MALRIENIGYSDCLEGNHIISADNAVLIQIVDPDMDFPKPKYTFDFVYYFKFLDIEGKDAESFPKYAITDRQALTIVEALKTAIVLKQDVVVHCVMGVCRSGAVVSIGEILGFEPVRVPYAPNLLVKHKMLKALGIAYE